MNKSVLIILTLAALGVLAIIFLGGKSGGVAEVNNVEVRNGVQYVAINAQGGYSPMRTKAKADLPTKLIVKTNGTFDCSRALVVRDAGFQQILPDTGAVEIDLGTKKAGDKVEGTCSMGMYSFAINFEAEQ